MNTPPLHHMAQVLKWQRNRRVPPFRTNPQGNFVVTDAQAMKLPEQIRP